MGLAMLSTDSVSVFVVFLYAAYSFRRMETRFADIV